jgi:hypothetical protein
MNTKIWLGGTITLSLVMSLALAGGALAQSQERGYGSGSGSYGSESGYQKGKKSGSEGSLGICTPESCPGTGKRQGSGYQDPGKTGKYGKGKLDKGSSSGKAAE